MKSLKYKIKYERISRYGLVAILPSRLDRQLDAMGAVLQAIRDHIKHEIIKK